MADTELLNELLDIERRGWDSLCDSTGADFYGSLMSDDAVMILANGAIMDRADVVESLRNAPAWHKFEVLGPRVIDGGTDTKILVYTGVAYRDDEAPAFLGVMSSVYIRSANGWALALYQQTALTE